ncbi:hypothetical protein LCGC14_2887000, partial [marine sediment metagenome]
QHAKGHKLSNEAKQKISNAAKRRWANKNKENE